MGSMCVSGESAAIQRLQQHLQETGIGTITPNFKVFVIQ